MAWWRNRSTNEKIFWVMLVFGLLGRLLVVPYGVYVNDMKFWADWGQTLVNERFNEYFTVGWSDRLPGGILYILWLMALLQRVWPTLSNELVYKLPATIADVALAYLIFRLVGKRWGEEKGKWTALLYFYNPFIWHITALWGQMDSVQALLLLLILLALFRNWYGVAVMLLVYAVQFKPHSIIISPLIFLYWWKMGRGWNDFGKRLGVACLVFLSVWWVLSIPFLPHTAEHGSDTDKLFGPYKLSWHQWLVAKEAYPYSSVNAFNFWGGMRLSWIVDQGRWLGITYSSWGYLMFAVTGLLILWKLAQKSGKPRLDDYIYSLALLFLAAFVFLTRVHERHILPFFLLYLLVVWQKPSRLVVFVLVTIIMVTNNIFAYGWLFNKPWIEPNGRMMSLLSLMVVLIFLKELYELVWLTKDNQRRLQ